MWQLSKWAPRLSIALLGLFGLNACYHPPYNRFHPQNRTIKPMAKGMGVGTVIGAVAGNTLAGAAVGGAAGAAVGIYRNSKQSLINDLENQSIQYVEYGDTNTLIVPTDKYFMYGSPRINELAYPGLANIISLLNLYPNNTIYVAGFTDDIGSRKTRQKITQAQAEAMLTFLWANGINAELLHAEGYGSMHPVGDNKLIHGSAFNRRLEIQWYPDAPPKLAQVVFHGWKK